MYIYCDIVNLTLKVLRVLVSGWHPGISPTRILIAVYEQIYISVSPCVLIAEKEVTASLF